MSRTGRLVELVLPLNSVEELRDWLSRTSATAGPYDWDRAVCLGDLRDAIDECLDAEEQDDDEEEPDLVDAFGMGRDE